MALTSILNPSSPGIDEMDSKNASLSGSDEKSGGANVQTEEVEGEGKPTLIHRGLRSHHIALLSIGGVIGVGLFVGSGGALVLAGPGSLLISYTTWCALLWCVGQSAGEMSSFLPVPGAFGTHVSRFVDDAAGCAVGWAYVYSMMMNCAADTSALVSLWAYWFPDVSPAVWVTITIAVIFCLNCMAVRFFGAAEFHFAIFKIFLIVGFLLFAFITVLGGNPQHDRIGFRYWKNPGAFNEQYTTGALGRFCAFWSCFVFASFAISGPEILSVCAPEAINPRRVVPKSVRRVIWRLTIFFVLSVLAIGMLVPSNSPALIAARATGKGVAASPFVVAINNFKIPFLPNLINAVVITSAWSSCNSMMYTGSRTLHGLALNGRAPKFLGWTTKSGVPLFALLFVHCGPLLAYMAVNTSATVVLNWLINLGATANMLAYINICWAQYRFRKGLLVQGIQLESLPFLAKFYPWTAIIGGGGILLILLTNGYGVFIKGQWDIANFFTAYFGIALYAFVFCFWKVWKKTTFVRYEDMDFKTGMDEINAHEASLNVQKPVTRYDRFMDWLW